MRSGQLQSAKLVRTLLIIAGDIENNPGSPCNGCSKPIRANQSHLTCLQCNAVSHKQEKCSGLSRKEQDKGEWTCIECITGRCQVSVIIHPTHPSPPHSVSAEDKINGNNKCDKCENLIRMNNPHLTCTVCNKKFHKQQRCSGLRRNERDQSTWKYIPCAQHGINTTHQSRRRQAPTNRSDTILFTRTSSRHSKRCYRHWPQT